MKDDRIDLSDLGAVLRPEVRLTRGVSRSVRGLLWDDNR